jgi:acetylornithine deacetylase/succinyl-diaminopimelate desuccinylase-like protein
MSHDRAAAVNEAAARFAPRIVAFLRDMIAIPSESAGERAVVERCAAEMRALGFDEVKIDGFGNVLGRVGHGPRVVAIDGHLDTVGVGDRGTWTRDPYAGVVEGGVIYGRGASDQEAGVAAAVYGAAIARSSGCSKGSPSG